ncbi:MULTISPECIES: hypothetical protein [unclassified Streptomyces]|uniref:hypothetical protein n=1 Tax=unclassified Streptomyces TaxID=2593676 RepID=UPI00093CB0C3|nr:hypothetical protein [Streptomyces sp. CB02009]OKJ59991.1 hypothetical protein AMK27_21285 [Streptomyces sp. CB02009]
MTKTPDDLSTEITALKTYLTKSDASPLITEQYLQKQLPEQWTERFKSMYDELTKAKKSEFLEAMGLDGFGAALEKFYENRENPDNKWGYYLASAVVGLMLPAIGLILAAWVIKIQRDIQQLPARLMGNPNGRVLATSDTGRGIRLQDRTAVEDREGAAAGGLASLPQNANFDALRAQLEGINPPLKEFNTQAGPFTTKFKDLPKASAMVKAADAVGRINTAVKEADPAKIETVAKAIDALVKAVKDYDPKKVPDPKKLEKLNSAMVDANPTQIQAMAKATGKLASAQRHFDPKKLPKARGLESSARAAERLARAGGDVASAFNTLKVKAQEAAQAMA